MVTLIAETKAFFETALLDTSSSNVLVFFQRLHLKVHDKNLVHSNSNQLLSHLKQRRNRNKQLMRMRSIEDNTGQPKFPKSLSFNMDGSRAVPERIPSHVRTTLQ